jgi:hypothetical protein
LEVVATVDAGRDVLEPHNNLSSNRHHAGITANGRCRDRFVTITQLTEYTNMSDKTVRIPERLWPALEEMGRRDFRSPSEMCRYLIERQIFAEQMKKQQPQQS